MARGRRCAGAARGRRCTQWLLSEVEAYIGWREMRDLAAAWPARHLIVRGDRGGLFTVSGSTVRWLEAAQRWARSRVLRGELAALRRDVRWGVWARYGFKNGDLSSHDLDEPSRMQGSSINKRWRSLRPRLQSEVPDRLELAARRRAWTAIIEGRY